MKSISVLAALFIASVTYGQDYIVSQKGDTLRGEIRVLSYDLMDRVQLVVEKKKTSYTALQTRSVSMKGEKYMPVRYENAIRMMKVIRSGFLSLYAFKLPNQTSFDGRIMVKPGDIAQEVPNLGFKKYVGSMVDDCPQVADRIRTGDLERKDLEQIVDLYNACVAQARQQRFVAAESSVGNPTTELIDQLKTRVNSSELSNKSEVNDLLSNIGDKVRKKETVPGYMKEGLKSYLSQREEFKEDVEKLLSLIQ